MARRNPWLKITSNVWSLGLEAAAVISLRTLKIAHGDSAAGIEAQKMISEKLEAAGDLQRMAFSGILGNSPQAITRNTIAHYRRKVRANRRRLTKG